MWLRSRTQLLRHLRPGQDPSRVASTFFSETRSPHAVPALERSHLDERLLSAHQLVAFQETKFNKEDSLQTNEHYLHTADSGGGRRCYWSDTTAPVFRGRHGVGLVLSPASPFGEVEDITARAYKGQLQNRYLRLKTTLGDKRAFSHVVYAPDDPMHRGEFFRALPTQLDEDAISEDDEDGDAMHIVLGDFNTTLDNYLDQASPSQHQPGTDREELCDWPNALGLVDAWRFVNPEARDFTSPPRKHRLGYCFLTVELSQDHLATIAHAQEYLVPSAKAVADRIKIFPGANPGCLLDEHKRTDCIYLRRRWIELRNADARAMTTQVEAVNSAVDPVNILPTDTNK
ncbi:hypothetical protein ON010_g9753 [Phytophthora cinnamomi]|nr:hypothetical protein ON010_g9753 [Phytophthora cinnamomi]